MLIDLIFSMFGIVVFRFFRFYFIYFFLFFVFNWWWKICWWNWKETKRKKKRRLRVQMQCKNQLKCHHRSFCESKMTVFINVLMTMMMMQHKDNVANINSNDGDEIGDGWHKHIHWVHNERIHFISALLIFIHVLYQ